MENTGYVALSHQVALEKRMGIVANNIANMNTTGYQSQHMLFTEHINREDNEPLSQVLDYGTYRNLSAGPIAQTGNDLDVALNGPGFFSVQGQDGEEKFSRNGSFQLTLDRQLVNSAGLLVLDEGGSPISIPDGQDKIFIDENGDVSTDAGALAKLKISRFDNPQDMQLIGDSLLETEQQPLPDTTTKTIQGALEQSNVNPIVEMTDMISVSRTYQSAARLLQNQHDSDRDTIRRLSQV